MKTLYVNLYKSLNLLFDWKKFSTNVVIKYHNHEKNYSLIFVYFLGVLL